MVLLVPVAWLAAIGFFSSACITFNNRRYDTGRVRVTWREIATLSLSAACVLLAFGMDKTSVLPPPGPSVLCAWERPDEGNASLLSFERDVLPPSGVCRWDDGYTQQLVPSFVAPTLFGCLGLAAAALATGLVRRSTRADARRGPPAASSYGRPRGECLMERPLSWRPGRRMGRSGVPAELRRSVVERLRARADMLGRAEQLADAPPPVQPTPQRLRTAIAAVAAAHARAAEELADLLLAVDQHTDPTLPAEAERLLLRASPPVWLRLDVASRRAWWRAPHWSAAAVRKLIRDELSPLGLTAAACHPDGYVREAAVAGLAATNEALALPVLALRAADWVPQVRDRARTALAHRLAEPSGTVVLGTAPVALALHDRTRGRWLTGHIDALLREVPRQVLNAALSADDWRTRRAAHLTALAAGRLDLEQLLYAAQHDGDLRTRVRCAEAAVRAATAAGTVDRVRLLLTSGAALVRAEAVHALARTGDPAPAHTALADRNPTVRAVAQAALRRIGEDPAQHYRRLAQVSHPAPGVIAGIGETGTSPDASRLRTFLDHPRPRARAEAVRALRRLGAADPDVLAPLLTDPSGAVTRQVSLALRPRASDLGLTHLKDLLGPTRPWHIRLAAYRLLHARDVWTRLRTDLGLVADASPSMRNRARNDLANWLDHEATTTYAMPHGPTAKALTTLLSDAAPHLGPHRTRLLRFHLGLGSSSAP